MLVASDMHEDDKVPHVHSSLLTSLRNNLAKSPLGYRFASYHALPQEEFRGSPDGADSTEYHIKTNCHEADQQGYLPTPPDTPPHSTPSLRRLSRQLSVTSTEVKRVLSGFAGRTRAGSASSSASASSPPPALAISPSRSPSRTVSESRPTSVPPATMDGLSSMLRQPIDAECITEDVSSRTPSSPEVPSGHQSRIAQGKRPQRASCYDSRNADVGQDSPPSQTNVSGELAEASPASDGSDAAEWQGLEYALELSRCERRKSAEPAASSEAVGEYSKSREAWAAIHSCGNAGFMFGDQAEPYLEWKKWHEHLETRCCRTLNSTCSRKG
ncbi:hypothetical protein B0H21DRAFT_193756 [Amylocystis lapponica]|nr:hypothetical protein B0H21DRAFT_193756 [Amylocystis lapponica]